MHVFERMKSSITDGWAAHLSFHGRKHIWIPNAQAPSTPPARTRERQNIGSGR
jgi:hypothetical protein